MMEDAHGAVEIRGEEAELFRYTPHDGGPRMAVSAPVVEIESRQVQLWSSDFTLDATTPARPDGLHEYRWSGRVDEDPRLTVNLVLQTPESSPVIRYRFNLAANEPTTLTRSEDRDRIEYLSTSLSLDASVTEVTLSEFDRLVHSHRPVERTVTPRERGAGLRHMGPILAASDVSGTIVIAYEHGSETPDAFLAYRFSGSDRVTLEAVKGNYWHGFPIGPESGFSSIWFDLLSSRRDLDGAASLYRRFVLDHQSPNRESRVPYIFYNTWNYQERNHAWNGRPYLESMNEARMLREIDVAHQTGIDVFVIDTGWYEKTGDWAVSTERFPRGLAPIRERIESYGMKLGLWFSPTQAALSSRAVREYGDCVMTRGGERPEPRRVWETEESHGMCLVSRYWEAFADELIRCHQELGVTYFKWDAIGQYGCDDPNHEHGSEMNTPEERSEAYAFRQVIYMSRIVDRLCTACPDAIVDFDITEAGRSVGLAFLASGKFFLINNGPYFRSFDLPHYDARAMVSTEGGQAIAAELEDTLRYDFGMGSNVMAYPGPARAQNCRVPLDYDRWIPSVLLLTHYLPDDPKASQAINLASLMLGNNGIWGDLPGLSAAGIEFLARTLACYKRVRDKITRASLVRTGTPGSSPEIYEKIDSQTGCGLVCAFSSARGTFPYVPVARRVGPIATSYNTDAQRRASPVLTFRFPERGAAFALFGP